MIQFILNCIEFFIFCLIQIKSIFDAALIVTQPREYVTPENAKKYLQKRNLTTIIKPKRMQNEKERKLPNELLNLIFNHIDNKQDLYSCTRVSKQWHSVVSPILWKSATPSKPILSCLPAFAKMEINLKTKHFHQPSHFSPFFNLKHYGRYIKSLDLSKISQTVTDCTITYIVANCPNLTSINLSNCQHISDFSLQVISRNTDVQHLNLKNCRQLSDPALTYFADLESLDLGRCHGFTDKGIASTLSANGTTLRHLSLYDVHVTKTILKTIARSCGPRLESLSLSRTKAISHKEIHYVVYHCPNLIKADFSLKNKKITPFDELMHSLSRYDITGRLPPAVVHQYEELLTRHVTHRTVSVILQHCKNLQDLTLMNWHCIDNPSLDSFTKGHNLTYLNLIGCQSITQEGLQSLSNRDNKSSLYIVHETGCKYLHYESDDTLSTSTSSPHSK